MKRARWPLRSCSATSWASAFNASATLPAAERTVDRPASVLGAIVGNQENCNARRNDDPHCPADTRKSIISNGLRSLTQPRRGLISRDAVAFRAARVALRWRGLFRLAAAAW